MVMISRNRNINDNRQVTLLTDSICFDQKLNVFKLSPAVIRHVAMFSEV